MDIWKIGIVDRPFDDVAAHGLGDAPIRWIAEPDRYSFLADPFGIERDGKLYVFAEAYDYRRRLGRIEVLTLDAKLEVLDRRPCLSEAWHLSYPVPIELGENLFLLPEAARSGRLTLYRASSFPHGWERYAQIDIPELAVDATPLFHDGLWWLFYSPAGARVRESSLHAAYSQRLEGPWTLHPHNPIRVDPAGARPGGTARIVSGQPVLPVQDCSRGYGASAAILRFDILSPDRIETSLGPAIGPPASAAPFTDGLHTVSACGNRTLIDVKRIERSVTRLRVDALGRSRRAVREWNARRHRNDRG